MTLFITPLTPCSFAETPVFMLLGPIVRLLSVHGALFLSLGVLVCRLALYAVRCRCGDEFKVRNRGHRYFCAKLLVAAAAAALPLRCRCAALSTPPCAAPYSPHHPLYHTQVLPYTSLWVVIPIEAMHGITYGLGWSACALTCASVAPRGLEATVQALFQVTWTGIGQGFGGLLGGLLYRSVGPQAMFLGASGVLFVTGGAGAVALRAVAPREEPVPVQE